MTDRDFILAVISVGARGSWQKTGVPGKSEDIDRFRFSNELISLKLLRSRISECQLQTSFWLGFR